MSHSMQASTPTPSTTPSTKHYVHPKAVERTTHLAKELGASRDGGEDLGQRRADERARERERERKRERERERKRNRERERQRETWLTAAKRSRLMIEPLQGPWGKVLQAPIGRAAEPKGAQRQRAVVQVETERGQPHTAPLRKGRGCGPEDKAPAWRAAAMRKKSDGLEKRTPEACTAPALQGERGAGEEARRAPEGVRAVEERGP